MGQTVIPRLFCPRLGQSGLASKVLKILNMTKLTSNLSTLALRKRYLWLFQTSQNIGWIILSTGIKIQGFKVKVSSPLPNIPLYLLRNVVIALYTYFCSPFCANEVSGIVIKAFAPTSDIHNIATSSWLKLI